MKRILIAAFFLSSCSTVTPRTPSSIDPCLPGAAGTLPNPDAPAGRPAPEIPVEHVVVLMQENHSFDNYFGRLNKSAHYGAEVDGVKKESFSYDEHGTAIHPFHSDSLCVEDLDHSRDAMANAAEGEGNHNFARNMGARSMGFFDDRDIPWYYALADRFAISDRYFSSMLGPTYPNRFYLWAATSFGHDDNTDPEGPDEFRQKTIFDLLDDYGITWKYYTEYTEDFKGGPGYLSLFGSLWKKSHGKVGKIADFSADAAAGRLPSVAFVDADETKEEDEHPSANIRMGQIWVAKRLEALFRSPLWNRSALFLTYDEGGGFYDHVSPPAACAPDALSPEKFRRYGFRVPFVAVSPYAKSHYVSHHVYDHSSVLKFIETKWNLPALTNRDGHAEGLLDLFDFSRSPAPPPELPVPPPSGETCWSN